MNQFDLRFHHLGLAVAKPQAAFLYLSALDYQPGHCCYDPLQGVNLAMRHHASMPDVEVIWPGDGPSPIDRMLKRSGSLIYHLCYWSSDVENSIKKMEAAGLEILPLGPAKQALLFNGIEVSFFSVTDVGVIEIIHGAPAEVTLQRKATAQSAAI
jgi:hypothetical protein